MSRTDRDKRQALIPPSAIVLATLISANWNPRKGIQGGRNDAHQDESECSDGDPNLKSLPKPVIE